MSEKKNKHTPGPWVVGNVGEVVAGGTTLADVYGDDEQADVDARLIAAAPEMLEVLESALAYLVMAGTDHAEPTRAAIRAAIKKARGEK